MNPRIKQYPEKLLVGQKLIMSFAENRTGELWRVFMPRIKEIRHRIGPDLFSLQRYPFPPDFNPVTSFEKWAAAEVDSISVIPKDMEIFRHPGGLYAIFDYKGLSTDTRILEYIFTTWLPTSGYSLDDRPHFEILGEKYRNNDPESEEEICIPVRPVE